MPDSGKMQLNKLNYDRDREMVEFSLRRSLGETAISISGEIPLMVVTQGDVRPYAKAAVRQALLDAADVLACEKEAEEGMRPENLNASNDD